jgi:DNA-binding transcriptional LysR family regulator
MDWDDLHSFLAIARSGSLSGAARELGVGQSTMSRRLAALETRAGARLLQKTPSGYALTTLGEMVLGNAERMESEAIAIERSVVGCNVALSGLLRITTVDTLAHRLLPPAVARLREQHPGISVEIIADGRALSLSRREADIALRMTRFEGNEIVARKVGEVPNGLFASHAYLARAGTPSDDGSDHAIITTLEDQAHLPESRWLATRFPKAQVALRSNDREVHLGAARAGIGIVLMSRYLAQTAPELVEIPTNTPMPERDIWLGMHQDMRRTPRIRACVEAIDAELKLQGLASGN